MSSLSSPDETALPPPASLAIHLDLVGGLAGDMFVAALVDALNKVKPASSKGIYLRKISVSSTMGIGVRVDAASLNG